MTASKNLTGLVFYQLTAIRIIGKTKNNKNIWECRCTCGSICKTIGAALVSGNTKSCGCRKRATPERFIGVRSVADHQRAYNSWVKMKFRCNDKSSPDYKIYGGRGIKICDEWLDFWNFVSDMGDPPEGKTIDRIDSNGNYYKDNCRWATHTEQARNMRSNVHVMCQGKKVTVIEASIITGIPASTIYSRAAKIKRNGKSLFNDESRKILGFT